MASREVPDKSLKLRTPLIAYLNLVNRCNLACRYCYYSQGPGKTAYELDTGQWLAILDKLAGLKVAKLILTGGEPLLHEGFAEILRRVGDGRWRFVLTTNGVLLTEEIVAALAVSGRCEQVHLSLDGPEACNDAMRGIGAYQQTVRALALLRRHRIPCAVRCTVGPHNCSCLAETMEHLLEFIPAASLEFSLLGTVPGARDTLRRLQLTPAQQVAALREIDAAAQRYRVRFGGNCGEILRSWRRIYGDWKCRSADSGRGAGGSLGSCQAYFTRMVIRADGKIAPCTALMHLVTGDALRDDIAVLWRHSPVWRQLRERSSVELRRFRPCRDCPFLAFCSGSCTADPADFDRPPNTYCLRNYLPYLPDIEQLLELPADRTQAGEMP